MIVDQTTTALFSARPHNWNSLPFMAYSLVAALALWPVAGCGKSSYSMPAQPAAIAVADLSADQGLPKVPEAAESGLPAAFVPSDQPTQPSSDTAAIPEVDEPILDGTLTETSDQIGTTQVLGAVAVQDDSVDKAAMPVKEVTFDDVKFDIAKDSKFERKMLTPSIEALLGRRIKIRGYILPQSVFRNTKIKGFILVRDDQACCFGPGAAIYDCMTVQMVPPATADFSTRPIAVEGVLSLQQYDDDEGITRQLYHLKATSAQ